MSTAACLMVPATASADETGGLPPGAESASGHALEGTDPAGFESSPEEAAAVREAERTGQAVEVAEMRGEVREVWALPDGTVEVREFVVPRWTRVGDAQAGWSRVDLALRETPEGAVAPAASTVDMEFSGGGEVPLVTLVRHGRVLEWSWPQALPEPLVEGDTATYVDVIEGVDLEMTAVEDGFSSFLVVKTQEAAVSPELDEITFAMQTEGLDVAVSGDGVLEATDTASGATVFEAPPAAMWEAGEETLSGAARAQGASIVGVDSTDGATGQVAPVEVAVSPAQDTVTLTPDQALLEDPSTNFPVRIDPRLTTPRTSAWSSPNRVYPTQSYWQFKGAADAGLGTCAGWSNCPDGSTYRLLYQFDVSAFKGKSILGSTLVVPNTHSAVCSDHPVSVYHTRSFSSSTTWNSTEVSGFYKSLVTTQSFSYGGQQSGCNSAADAEFPVTSLIREGADARWNQVALGLRASESDKDHWKKFGRTAFLRTRFNSIPSTVSASALSMKYGGACTTSSDAPERLRTMSGNLMRVSSGAATDADPSERVRVQFQLQRIDGAQLALLSSSFKYKGSYFSMDVPVASIPQNAKVRWRVRVQDEYPGGQAYSSGEWSTGCWFVYDTTSPTPPVITSEGGEYPEPDPADPEDMPHDGVGEYGWFGIDSSSSDVVRYTYQFGNGAIVEKNAGSVRVAYLPLDPGDHRLTATAYDAAGNKATAAYDFRVNYGRDGVGRWTFDSPVEGEPAPSGFVAGGGAQVVEPVGAEAAERKALQLDGAEDWAEATVGSNGAPTGSVNTAGHFAVEAWVKPASEAPVGVRMIASQAGAVYGQGLMLYYAAGQGGWVFAQHESDAQGASAAKVVSDVPYRVGRWTHVLGTYDAYRNRLALYVDGVLAGEATYSGAWNATGRVMVGAARYGPQAAPQHFFDGLVDSVHTYDRVVTAPEALALGTRLPQVAARWTFEDSDVVTGPAGTVSGVRGATDPSGRRVGPSLGLPQTPTGQPPAADVTPNGWVDLNALTLDGSAGYAATELDQVPIAMDESFTIAGWAQAVGAVPGNRTVLSLTASEEEAVQLRFVPGTGQDELAGGKWHLVFRESNQVGAPVHTILIDDAPDASVWTHLAIVYDARRQTMSLYVNGALQEGSGTVAGVRGFTGVRRFSLGRGLSASVWEEHWPGAIDDVWMFRGALSPAQVRELAAMTGGNPTEVPGGL